MKVFVSHASEDRPVAEQIQIALAGEGYEVVFDGRSIFAS